MLFLSFSLLYFVLPGIILVYICLGYYFHSKIPKCNCEFCEFNQPWDIDVPSCMTTIYLSFVAASIGWMQPRFKKKI